MPIKINEASGEQFLVVHVWGKLAKADYERFLPRFAELSTPRKLRLLFDMIGWGTRAPCGTRSNSTSGTPTTSSRDSRRQRLGACHVDLDQTAHQGEGRYFDATQYAAAREWLSE